MKRKDLRERKERDQQQSSTTKLALATAIIGLIEELVNLLVKLLD